MSKTKKSGAGYYEILFIVPNKFTEEEAKKISSKVEKMITDVEGKLGLSEFWGKKKLAYKINHNEYGYYSLLEFELSKEKLAKLDRELRLSTEILRHQIVTKKRKTEEELKKDEEIRVKIDSKKGQDGLKNKKDEKYDSRKVGEEKRVKLVKKADPKELDEKIEGILNADDLI